MPIQRIGFPFQSSLVFTERLKELENELSLVDERVKKRDQMLMEAQELSSKRLEEIDELHEKLDTAECQIQSLEIELRREHAEKVVSLT
jgi:lipid II:glycine glycyltransferase (peptidoglycan interpeptide bridge formation enzyme)